MRDFIHYFVSWLRNSSRPALLLTVFLVAALVAANYTIGIESRIQTLPWYFAIAAFFAFFSLVLSLVWGLQYEWGWKEQTGTPVPTLRGGRITVDTTARPSGYFQPGFVLLLALSALFFSLKMVHWDLSSFLPHSIVYPWNRYTLLVIQLPLKLILLLFFLYCCRKGGLIEGDSLAASVGLTARGFKPAPYFGLLALLVPLIALASTQHDFLQVYPKVQILGFLNGYAQPSWPWRLLYELSYGLDFLGIELFFRGLLVIGVLRYAGTDAILPMAAFYCTIHFGKPMGECITSFFGGLVLGVLAARTRTILGGLIVHLGLAWLMELGGWLGHLWTR
jgi:hypothetical protein